MPDLRVLHRLNESLTAKAIAEAFAVSRRTVFRWLALPLDFKSPPRTGRRRKIGDENADRVLEIIGEKPWVTMKDVRELLGIECHTSTVYAFMRRHRITKKRGHTLFNERDEDAVEKFKLDVKAHVGVHMALDEASFCLNQSPRYGWAPRGHRAYIRRAGSRGKRMSLLLCVADSRTHPIVGYHLADGTFNAPKFHEFIEQKVASSGRLIMDNASIHKATHSCRRAGKTTIGDLCQSKNIEPTYLPPYSPTLNPVELCFNFIRTHVRRQFPNTVDALRHAVDDAIGMLGAHVPRMFDHCFDRATD
jgi:transposase